MQKYSIYLFYLNVLWPHGLKNGTVKYFENRIFPKIDGRYESEVEIAKTQTSLAVRRGTAKHFENSEWCSEASRYKASRSVHLTDFELGRRISNHMMNFIMISVVRKFYANFLCLWHVMTYHNRPQNTIVSKGNSLFWFNVYTEGSRLMWLLGPGKSRISQKLQ